MKLVPFGKAVCSMKHGKKQTVGNKAIAALLSALLVASMFPTMVGAETIEDTKLDPALGGTYTVDQDTTVNQNALAGIPSVGEAADKVNLKDSITISDQNGTIVLQQGEEVKELTSNQVNLSGSISNGSIVVEGGVEITLALRNVSIISKDSAALWIKDDSKVTLLLEGRNTFTSADRFAGIQVQTIGDNENESGPITVGKLTISKLNDSGSASLTATGGNGGAGIGGGKADAGSLSSSKYQKRDGGEITILGGQVTALGGKDAAGIGGGDHGDGGVITIGGVAVIEQALGLGEGAGIGSGLGSNRIDGIKGPGFYYGGDITIQDDAVIKDATSGSSFGGAGIGGGSYCDSGKIIIKNNARIILAQAKLSDTDKSPAHHGGAGIGGGYQGYSDVTIQDNAVVELAVGAGGGAGIGAGGGAKTGRDTVYTGSKSAYKGQTFGPSPYDRSLDEEITFLTDSVVNIDGGTVNAQGGDFGGAGIGSGAGTDLCKVNITGGVITARGGESDEDEKIGGSGIGSGAYNVEEQKIDTKLDPVTAKDYHSFTDVQVGITGGEVLAVGGWGASGIGAGSRNGADDMRNSESSYASDYAVDIEISSGVKVSAFADGTRFAIDSDQGETELADVNETVLQGTFLAPYRGMEATIYENLGGQDETIMIPGNALKTLKLPKGYRSFAANVPQEGSYLVKASGSGVDDSYFCYNTEKADRIVDDEGMGVNYSTRYEVVNTSLSDNYFLYPCKLLTVTFVANGGSEVPQQVVRPSGKAANPNPQTERDGFKFLGWHTSEALDSAYDFTTAVEKDITLYAAWEETSGGGGNNGGSGGGGGGGQTVIVPEVIIAD